MSDRSEPADDTGPQSVIIDTDTAGDDSQALLLAATSDRVEIEGVTICAGNVEFDYQVENAKYTLDVHGEGGLGGSLFPDTGIESGDRHGADFIVDAARERPGELTLVCIAPLTNVALALRKEPELGDLLDSVWVMGGNVNCLGNVTPAAEYNFWVDPDAAKLVLNELDVTLFDWGLTLRDTVFDTETLAQVEATDTPYADFYSEITTSVRAFNRESFGEDITTQPDSAVVAGLIDPELIRGRRGRRRRRRTPDRSGRVARR